MKMFMMMNSYCSTEMNKAFFNSDNFSAIIIKCGQVSYYLKLTLMKSRGKIFLHYGRKITPFLGHRFIPIEFNQWDEMLITGFFHSIFISKETKASNDIVKQAYKRSTFLECNERARNWKELKEREWKHSKVNSTLCGKWESRKWRYKTTYGKAGLNLFLRWIPF